MDPKTTECGPNPESPYTPAFLLTDELISAVETAPRGEAITFGATPYDKLTTLASQQVVLKSRRLLMAHITNKVPPIIADYAQTTFDGRFWARLNANDENFSNRLLFPNLLDADPRLHPLLDRGRVGVASPAELMLAHDQVGAKSLEVACLTHPYGVNLKKQLPVMREAVHLGIEALGGTYDDEPQPRYSMKDILRDEAGSPIALLMTRKRDVGILPSSESRQGSIIRERSSFIMRIDNESRFRNIFIEQDTIDRFVSIAGQDKPTQQKMLQEFNGVISMFLEFDLFTEAIPIATTTYVFNRETAALVAIMLEARGPLPAEQDLFDVDAFAQEIRERQAVLEAITARIKRETMNVGSPEELRRLQ